MCVRPQAIIGIVSNLLCLWKNTKSKSLSPCVRASDSAMANIVAEISPGLPRSGRSDSPLSQAALACAWPSLSWFDGLTVGFPPGCDNGKRASTLQR